MSIIPRPLLIIGAIIGGVILLAILSVVGIIPGGRKPPAPEPATVVFWGIEDDERAWIETFQGFKKLLPHLDVQYRKLEPETYETTLVNALAEGKGPDVFALPNTLATKHREKLLPLPANPEGITARTFSRIFVDGPVSDLVPDNTTVVGLPLSMDTPLLLYNKDAFNAAGIAQAPATWENFVTVSQQLTSKTKTNDILKGGAALGSFQNVERAFQVLSSLILQNNDPIVTGESDTIVLDDRALNAVTFYTSFADPKSNNYTWNSRQPKALSAFAAESVAMAFGLSGDIPRLLAQNPHLNLGIAPFPQQTHARAPVVYGTYHFAGVSRLSKNPIAAWQLVLYLTSKDGAETYLKAARRPAARRDLIAAGAPTPELDVSYQQALIAKTWKTPDAQATQRLFRDMIESVVLGAATPKEALDALKDQLPLLFAKPR